MSAASVRMLQKAAVPYRREGYTIAKYEDGILTLVQRHHMNPILFWLTLPFAFFFEPPSDKWVFLTVIEGRVITQKA